MTTGSKKPLKLFYCYAREDKGLRDELDIHLSSLKRQNLVTSWYDGEIGPGTEWEKEIDKQLRSAHKTYKIKRGTIVLQKGSSTWLQRIT